MYWLNTRIAPGQDRTFTILAKVSPLLPSGPVIISTLVYAQDASGTVVCASGLPDATVSIHVRKHDEASADSPTTIHMPSSQPKIEIRNKRGANKRDHRSRKANECPRPQASTGVHYINAHDQRLLYGRLAIATAATPDLCHLACRYEDYITSSIKGR